MEHKSEKLFAKAIEEYGKDKENHLEIRFKEINKEAFEGVYSQLLEATKKGSFVFSGFEYSVDAISFNLFNDKNPFGSVLYVRKQEFSGAKKEGETPKKTSDKLFKEVPQIRPIHLHTYLKGEVFLFKQEEVAHFNTSQNAKMKIRVKAPFVNECGNWEVSVIANKTGNIKELGPISKKIIKKLFVERDKKSFIEEFNYEFADNFEIVAKYVGEAQDLQEASFGIIESVLEMVDPNYAMQVVYQQEIYEVAQKIIGNHAILHLFKSKYRLKRLLNSAVSLTKSLYNRIYPPSGYYATDKADGQRCLVSINGARCRLLFDKMIEVLVDDPEKHGIKIADATHSEGEITIADGELVERGGKYHLYLFDVMYFRGKKLDKEPFSQRVDYIEDTAEFVQIYTSKEVSVKAKKFYLLEEANLENIFKKIYEGKYDYEIDGIIITSGDKDYERTISYKWKPSDQNTIDFLAIKVPRKLHGLIPFISREGHEMYALFVGIRYEMQEKLGLTKLPNYSLFFPEFAREINKNYAHAKSEAYYPIQFSPSANPQDYVYYHPVGGEDLDHQIVELRKKRTDGKLGDWELVRIRHDRKAEKTYYGNNYLVAESNYQNDINPLNLEDLWRKPSGYFEKTADTIYTAPNKYKRYVIGELIKKYSRGAHWIVDLAGGRGADLKRWQDAGVRNAIFVDIDEDALSELIQRKFQIFEHPKKRHRFAQVRGGKPGMSVLTIRADITKEASLILAKIESFGANLGQIPVVMCNFAFHYFCTDLDSIRYVIRLINTILSIGGIFMMTVMDASRVFEKLTKVPYGEAWFRNQDGVLKYAIKKLYDGKKLDNFGQKVAVKLPFTDDMYEEPLCNVNFVIKEFKGLGFKLIDSSPFDKMMEGFKAHMSNMYGKINEIDVEYIKLHQYVCLKKQKGIAKK